MNSKKQVISTPLTNMAATLPQSASPYESQKLYPNKQIDVYGAMIQPSGVQQRRSLPVGGMQNLGNLYQQPWTQNSNTSSAGTTPSPDLLGNQSLNSVPTGLDTQLANLWIAPQGFSSNTVQSQNFAMTNQMGNSSSGVQTFSNILSPSNSQSHPQNFLQPQYFPQSPISPSPASNSTTGVNSALMNILPYLNQANLNKQLKKNTPQQQQPKNPRKVRQQEQLSANRERTVYISEIEHNVTEENIAILFSRCGDVVDVRLCGDAHSKMRFAFVEFSQDTWSFAVPEALKLNNTLLNGLPIRVQRSKTAIVPVKKELLPQNDDEMTRCMRTIYACNIDKRFTQQDVVAYFQTLVADESTGADGRVSRIKMMADSTHNTQIAFVEFYTDESVASALNNCQGALMGCLPLRVSPSKTPIRTAQEERALREARQIAS
eukprot:TRINITY_DN778_c0_g4_i2.p1 TRINITY_DN778_c0_g4~~TRINITY_DN778_c0_g4_i2.p1  ORF type:complete len:433 (-),score=50.88 TRINITY_DN778_c0_g4_i2:2845-4143(-)